MIEDRFHAPADEAARSRGSAFAGPAQRSLAAEIIGVGLWIGFHWLLERGVEGSRRSGTKAVEGLDGVSNVSLLASGAMNISALSVRRDDRGAVSPSVGTERQPPIAAARRFDAARGRSF